MSSLLETLKLIIGFLLSPLSVALVFSLFGMLCNVFGRTHQAVRGFVVATVVLILGSLPIWTYGSGRMQEYAIPPLGIQSLQTVEPPWYIVVLGAGFNADDHLPANSRVSGSYLARILEGVRIFRQSDEAKMIIFVSGKASDEPKQRFLADLLAILALDPDRVIMKTQAKSTEDEAETIRALLSTTEIRPRIILVTSAHHMKRAVATFEAAGIDPIPAPTDYQTTRTASPDDKPWQRFLPSSAGLGSTHGMLYDATAMLWLKIKHACLRQQYKPD